MVSGPSVCSGALVPGSDATLTRKEVRSCRSPEDSNNERLRQGKTGRLYLNATRYLPAWPVSIQRSAASSARSRPAASASIESGCDLVGHHALAFERRPVDVTKSPIAYISTSPFAQLLRRRRQRLPHRLAAEDARAAEALQPAGKTLRRARRQLVDENRDRPGKRRHAAAIGGRRARVRAKRCVCASRICMRPSRTRLGHQVTGDPAHHVRQPAGVAAKIDHESRRADGSDRRPRRSDR